MGFISCIVVISTDCELKNCMRSTGNFIWFGGVHCSSLNSLDDNFFRLRSFFSINFFDSIDKNSSNWILHYIDLTKILLQQIFDIFIVDFIKRHLYLGFHICLFLHPIKHIINSLRDKTLFLIISGTITSEIAKHCICLPSSSHSINKNCRVIPLESILNGLDHCFMEYLLIISLLPKYLFIVIMFFNIVCRVVRGYDFNLVGCRYFNDVVVGV